MASYKLTVNIRFFIYKARGTALKASQYMLTINNNFRNYNLVHSLWTNTTEQTINFCDILVICVHSMVIYHIGKFEWVL